MRDGKQALSPLRGLIQAVSDPGLTPWAAFLRRFAAKPERRTGAVIQNKQGMEKAGLAPAFYTNPSAEQRGRILGLLGGDCVLGGLGDTEFYDRLGFDLDRFAGLRIASHAGFAMSFYQAAQSGHDEYAILLGLFYGGVGEVLEKCGCGLVVDARLLRQVADELGLGHT